MRTPEGTPDLGAAAAAGAAAPTLGGDPVDTIFVAHYDAVYRYLARRVPRAVAEDLASETFVQAVARPGGYDPARGTTRA